MGTRIDYLQADKVLKDSLILNIKAQISVLNAVDSTQKAQVSTLNAQISARNRVIWAYRIASLGLLLAVFLKWVKNKSANYQLISRNTLISVILYLQIQKAGISLPSPNNNNMTTQTNYKGFILHFNTTTGSTLIYKGMNLIKCFASDECKNGTFTLTHNSIVKAKQYINNSIN